MANILWNNILGFKTGQELALSREQKIRQEDEARHERELIEKVRRTKYKDDPDGLTKATDDVSSAKTAQVYEGILARNRASGAAPFGEAAGRASIEAETLGSGAQGELSKNRSIALQEERPFIPEAVETEKKAGILGNISNMYRSINEGKKAIAESTGIADTAQAVQGAEFEGARARRAVAENVTKSETARSDEVETEAKAEQAAKTTGDVAKTGENKLHIRRNAGAAGEAVEEEGRLAQIARNSQANAAIYGADADRANAELRGARDTALRPLVGDVARGEQRANILRNSPAYVQQALQTQYELGNQQVKQGEQAGELGKLKMDYIQQHPEAQHYIFGGRAPNAIESYQGTLEQLQQGQNPFIPGMGGAHTQAPLTPAQKAIIDKNFFRK